MGHSCAGAPLRFGYDHLVAINWPTASRVSRKATLAANLLATDQLAISLPLAAVKVIRSLS